MLPNAVDQHPGRERVFCVGDPAGELQPPMCRFAVGRRRGERLVERRDGGEKTGRNFRPGLVPFALLQQPDWLGCGAQICPPVDIKAELLLGRAALIGLPDRPCPEKTGDAVVVALQDGIELMVVAAGAFHRETEERSGRCVHHVLEPRVKVVGRVVRFIVPRAGANQAGGDHALLCSISDLVAGELLRDKPGVGHVVVQCVDHPVPVAPDVRL